MAHHKEGKQSPKDSQTFQFPDKSTINKFLNVADREISAWQMIKGYAYPTFLSIGTFLSIHYAINPVGNARRMIIENRMNPVLLRVKHALPFVFLGLLYKWADDGYYFKKVQAKKDYENKVEEMYKSHPELFRR